jgi:thiamine biosynthesis lipoprotein
MGTDVRLLAVDASLLPAARAEVERLAALLTPFDADSELSRLNADPRRAVPASADLCAAVSAALDGARATGGLADPTVQPGVRGRWREVLVTGGTITRPPGVRLDLCGSAKGWIADRVAAQLGSPCAVDCGGDISVRGRHVIHVEGAQESFEVEDGGIATSGIDRRGLHVLDPATGLAARPRTMTATAVAPTAAQAEALAKAKLLGGAVR